MSNTWSLVCDLCGKQIAAIMRSGEADLPGSTYLLVSERRVRQPKEEYGASDFCSWKCAAGYAAKRAEAEASR